MVDVPPILPGLPHEPPPKKTERSVDKDSFHKEMHKRVEKVTETDQEQKKKRKRQEESEDDDDIKGVAQGPTPPPDHITPFSLVEGNKKVSPLDMQKGASISPLASAQPSPMMGAAPPTSQQPPLMGAAPSPDEMEDDSGFVEETAFMVTMPEEETPTTALPTAAPQISAPPETSLSEQSPSSGRPSVPAPQESAAPPPPPVEDPASSALESKKKKTSLEPVPAAPGASKPKKALPKADQAKSPPVKEVKHEKAAFSSSENALEEKGMTSDEIELIKKPGSGIAEETGGFFEQFVDEKEKGMKKEIKPKETVDETEELGGAVAPITPLSPSDSIEKEKKEEEEVAALGMGGTAPGIGVGAPAPFQEAPAVNNPYSNLHPQVMDLFEKMVGTMTVMSHSGISETVVTLNAPKFASSVFFGSQIIIQEYSSAPHAFNIQLNGSPEALALFQGNADGLMAAFQYGNYNFRINRLDTGLLGQKHLIKRKGAPSGDKEDQRGSER